MKLMTSAKNMIKASFSSIDRRFLLVGPVLMACFSLRYSSVSLRRVTSFDLDQLYDAVYSNKTLGEIPKTSQRMIPTSVPRGASRTVLAHPVSTWPNHSSPVQDLGLKVFVYETASLPLELSNVTNCRLDFLVEETAPSNDNRITDIGMIQLFQTFVGRTYDAQEADIFVVPYPHATHCLSKCLPGAYKPNCGSITSSVIDKLLRSLKYFVGKDMDRHLFIFGAGHMLNPKLQMAALKVVHGGRIYKIDRGTKNYHKAMNPRDRDGSFLMPYMNTHPWMQPSVIRGRAKSWWTRPRKYSFVYIFGAKNKKMKDNPRIHRQRFQRRLISMFHLETNLNATLGGLPFILGTPKTKDTTTDSAPKSTLLPEDMLSLYQESTFCPCLPGDTPIQKRFFDVILSGCIPVVLKFPRDSKTSNATDNVYSWHPFSNSLLENTIPFYHPRQHDDGKYRLQRIDYKSFVVEVELPANSGNLERVMEDMLIHKPEELKRRQEAMSTIAPLLTYGLGPNDAHQYEDAFSLIIRGLNKYVDEELPPRENRT